MKHIYTITKADVGDGVYRHKFGSKMRTLLVSISDKFGGIGPKDVGKKIYRGSDGQLVWEGSFPPYKNNPRRRRKAKYRVRKNFKRYGFRKKVSRRRRSRK